MHHFLALALVAVAGCAPLVEQEACVLAQGWLSQHDDVIVAITGSQSFSLTTPLCGRFRSRVDEHIAYIDITVRVDPHDDSASTDVALTCHLYDYDQGWGVDGCEAREFVTVE